MSQERDPIGGPPVQGIAFVGSDKDAAEIEALLREEAIELRRYSLAALCEAIGDGGLSNGDGLLIGLIAERALSPANVKKLRKSVAAQPEWSDVPLLLIAGRDRLDALPELLEFGQVRMIEPPLHRGLLLRAVRSANRSRVFQHRGEALIEQLCKEAEERKAGEERLRESEEIYRQTVELSGQIIFTADRSGNTKSVGERFHEVTGTPKSIPPRELLPKLVHPEDFDRVFQSWKRAVRTGEPLSLEFRIRVADGSYRIFNTYVVPRCDDAGRVVRWYGFAEDVTDRKEATTALGRAEERYRLAARATNDAIWDWNLLTGHIAWSDAAAAYLGSEPVDNSTIQWWEQVIHPDDRQRVLRSIYGAINSDKLRWSAAYRMRKADGDYAYVYDRGFIIRDDQGVAVRAVGAVVDLTERRRSEAELRRTQAELIHVSRVSAMGTMASTLAHELNQPLTAVTSYVRGCRRLLADLKDPAVDQVCQALEYAEAGALRAGQIVRHLRELVARGTVNVGAEDLNKLVEDASVVAFVDEHLHGISHRIEIDRDASWVEADRIQIQQVLINLIRNAVQALQHAEQREVLISARAETDDMIEISVADSGSGIADSIRDALFSPFNSTKTEGMGIGLSISRTIIEAHHGRIWAEDGRNGGAVFRFTLPRAEVPSEDLLEGRELEAERRRAV